MLADTKHSAGFAVPDLEAASEFYQESLGLDVIEHEWGAIALQSESRGGPPPMIYPKPHFQPGRLHGSQLPGSDVDAAVDELTARGVEFLRYDGFDQDEKGSCAATGRTSRGSKTRREHPRCAEGRLVAPLGV